MLFKILYFLFCFKVNFGQWYYGALPQYYYPITVYANYPSSDVCKDYRSDCRIFEYICDSSDYSWYMDCCCKNTCDKKCREKDWENRRRRYKEMDINKNNKSYDQGSSDKAILNKYLGDIDRQNLLNDGKLNRAERPYEWYKWRDDDRWDRNKPNLPKEKESL